MKTIFQFLFIAWVCLPFQANAQDRANNALWPYRDFNQDERRIVSYRHMGQGNVKYHKRVHQVIDMRQKVNKPMTWPKSAFNQIVFNNIYAGKLTVYQNDSFSSTLSPGQVIDMGSDTQIVRIVDVYGMEKDTAIPLHFDQRTITHWRILEDWVFDYKYGDMRPRIVGIAPLYEPVFGGVPLPKQPMFYIKMEDLRPIIVQHDIFNYGNTAQRMSYDQFFQMRMFDSYVVKEENVYDLDIDDLPEYEDDGIAALLYGDQIKNDLFVTEHDVWEY